jgi:signal transduction histidine kinase
MHFTIQDLLDYAQIKADKFRKNFRRFNIRETVEKVMSIQLKSADDKGVRLYADYNNIAEDEEESKYDEGKLSPIIYSDEQRVMQVLLSLQSNALKYTK